MTFPLAHQLDRDGEAQRLRSVRDGVEIPLITPDRDTPLNRAEQDVAERFRQADADAASPPCGIQGIVTGLLLCVPLWVGLAWFLSLPRWARWWSAACFAGLPLVRLCVWWGWHR